jgi:hypothetical protein
MADISPPGTVINHERNKKNSKEPGRAQDNINKNIKGNDNEIFIY